jgi:diguanylate cyclase (GGDEF)-like protein
MHFDRAVALAAYVAVLVGLLVAFAWQGRRLVTLRRATRVLAEAAERMPWTAGEVLATLIERLDTQVRAGEAAIVDEPAAGTLWAPLDHGRYVALTRRRGARRFTRTDAALVTGLSALARASLEHAEHARQLRREVVTDHLTGLWTYQHWLDLLATASAERHGHQLGVVFLDCDGFRQINSRYGHREADRVLATVGARMRELSRTAGWSFCRFGGDEFAGWLLQEGTSADFKRRCDELAAALATPIAAGRHEVSLTASIGRTLSLDPEDTIDDLVEAAEIDMRRRKLRRPGADLSRHSEPDVVRRMLDAGGIAVAYQPIVTLADRRLWGCEALLRGHTGALGAIPPTALVESAAAAHLLDAVTREVMAQALATAEAARAVAGVPLTMTLNLEAEQFDPASDLLGWLVERVDASGVPVVLELSERQPLLWTAAHDALADELAGHGIGLGLDDIGAGVSRVNLLGHRSWELVKLDRGLLLEDHRGRGPIALRHVAQLLGEYGATGSLLEGIETAEQEALARDLDIRFGQGNGLAPAMSGEAFLDLAGRREAIEACR